MTTTNNPARTLHFEVRFADGAVLVEKMRNTFGGHLNMLDRIARRDGLTRFDVRASEAADGTVEFAMPNGRTFTLTEVSVL